MYIRFFPIITILFLSACSFKPEKIDTGTNSLNILNLKIKEGITNKSTIIENLGPPSIKNPFNKNVMYYVSQKMRKEIGRENQFEKIIILELHFNKNNTVKSYNLVNRENIDSFELNDLEDSQGFQDRKGFKVLKNILDNMRRKSKID